MHSVKLFLGAWIIVAVVFFISECLAVGFDMSNFVPGTSAGFIVFAGLMVAAPVVAYFVDSSVGNVKVGVDAVNHVRDSYSEKLSNSLEQVGLI